MREYLDSDKCRGKLSGSGYLSYCNCMNANFFKYPISNYQLQMLNKKVFQDFYDKLLTEKAKRTVQLPRQLCIRCCKELVIKSLLKENYAEQAVFKSKIIDEYDKKKADDLSTRKTVYSYEDIEKFYYAYKNNMSEYAVVVLFLLETGMRASEFASLRNDNIDIDKRRIDIVEARAYRFKDVNDHSEGLEEYVKVPKSKEARFVMMSDLCIECVLFMQEQTKLKCKHNPDNLLYPSFRSGRRRTLSSMETSFKNLCNKLKIERDVRTSEHGHKKGLLLHELRHTVDTIANTVAGANVVNTALMMGHKAITVENIYTHATEEALSTVKTPSQIVLEGYKTEEKKDELNNENKGSLLDMVSKLSPEEIDAFYELLKKMKGE